jgi:hypothetical protein
MKNYKNNDLLIKSLVLDLKRIVQGEIIGSGKMTDRFILEAQKCLTQIDRKNINQRVSKILDDTERVLNEKNTQRLADDALLYSNLLLHYTK